ncbi:site-specific integrase [Patescibacteria group bacterium]|nr:site-specific integrase [Patescibacteria group bacterium]MBP9709787.1 site-specific integrase [Patescibacteria group bacterium]
MAVRKPKGKGWQADFQVDGVRYRKSSPLNTKAAAEALEVLMRQALSQKGTIKHLFAQPKQQTPPSAPTFAAFSERWMTAYVMVNNKPSEQRAKRKILNACLLPFFGKHLLSEIKTVDVESYKSQELQRGISAKTINNRLAVLRKCLVTAMEWEELERVPKVQLLKTTPPRFRHLGEVEVQAILAASTTPMQRTMLLIAARTGLRFSELRALEWGDIDFGLKLLTVRRCAVLKDIGTPKNGRIRHISLTVDALAALESIRAGSGLVFTFRGKMCVHWTSLSHLQLACKKAGIDPIGWHTLRHTFASQLVNRGATLQAVQILLGHSTVNMTQRYAHMAPETMRETIKLLEPKPAQTEPKMSPTCLPTQNRNNNDLERLLQQVFVSPHI